MPLGVACERSVYQKKGFSAYWISSLSQQRRCHFSAYHKTCYCHSEERSAEESKAQRHSPEKDSCLRSEGRPKRVGLVFVHNMWLNRMRRAEHEFQVGGNLTACLSNKLSLACHAGALAGGSGGQGAEGESDLKCNA